MIEVNAVGGITMNDVAKSLQINRERMSTLLDRVLTLEQQVANQALEIHKKADKEAKCDPVALKSQAAQQQAQGLYAPLRSDTKPLIDLAAFARRLLNPDDLGHCVTQEVRNAARRALGMPEVQEYDL
jgi:hypothetical protein